MSFRLINVPAAFMDLMTCVFQLYHDMFSIVFMDDIVVYWLNMTDH